MSEMRLYTALYISGMPDILQGLPAGTELSFDEPAEWLNSGRAMVLLAVDPAFVELDEDNENLVLSSPLKMHHIDVVAVCDNSQECIAVNRSLSNMALEDITLYHGTTEDSARAINQNGWAPGTGGRGANFGQTRYLYCTSDAKNALWFANENGGDTILKMSIRTKDLIVDPEDGRSDSFIEEALLSLSSGLPANFAITAPVPASSITRMSSNDIEEQNIRIRNHGEKSLQNTFL